MAAGVKPAGTRSFANKRVFWVKTIANTAAPTVTEIKAATSLELSLLLYAGTGKPDADIGRADSPRRVGSSSVDEYFTTVKRTYGDLLYTYGPQEAATAAVNKAYTTLLPGEEGYVLEIAGLSAEDSNADTAIAANVWCRVWKGELGPQIEADTGDEDGAEFAVRQPVIVRDTNVGRVQIAA